MKKPLPIQLNIPHPCTQNRDEMIPTEKGRFCGHCQKTVIDFTTWSDTALYNFFAKNTGAVCGTMYETQLNRNIAIPYQPHSRLYRMTIAMGLTLLFTQAPQIMAQTRAPLVSQSDSAKHVASNNVQFGMLKGKIVNIKNEPVINTCITVDQYGVQIAEITTDFAGEFTISQLREGTYEVYAKLEHHYNFFERVVIKANDVTTLNFVEKKQLILIDGEIKTTQQESHSIEPLNPSRKVYTKEDIDNIPH